MKFQRIFAVCIASFALLISTSSRSEELIERAAITGDVNMAMQLGDFARLEALSTEYRDSQARTSSGLWKLTLFYSGLSTALCTRCPLSKEGGFWVAAEKLVGNWVKLYPKSPTARLAYAQMLLNRGWSYRGSGSASSVDPKNWKPYEEYTQRARAYLEANKAIAAKDPRWYEMMAVIAYRQSWSEATFMKLLDEGLSRHPSFYQLYFAAIDYFAPKWGGSAVAIEKFAADSLKRTQETEGYGMYARIYWYASQTQYDNSLFSQSLVDWSLMKKGIDDVLAKYPDGWNINYFARFACIAGDKPKTAELILRIESSPKAEAWGDMSTYERCKTWSKGALRSARQFVPRDSWQAAVADSLWR